MKAMLAILVSGSLFIGCVSDGGSDRLTEDELLLEEVDADEQSNKEAAAAKRIYSGDYKIERSIADESIVSGDPQEIDFLYVKVAGLNVRNGPGMGFGVVGSLQRGQMVKVISKEGIWYRIGDNKYISSKFLGSSTANSRR